MATRNTRVLVTGGCGFIGHHLVKHILDKTSWNIVVIDKLSYASKGLSRLDDIGATRNERVQVVTWDLCSPISTGLVHELKDVSVIVHMAAETHVDNSIEEPVACIENNVMSTVHMLEFARKLPNLERFLYFSTDEVYGPALGETMYLEWDRHNPTNPYSASKAAGEGIALSYHNSYKTPIVICNVMNVFGERQYVEKFIPGCIKKILNEETVDIHCYPGCEKAGTRFYIHALHVASAVMFLLENAIIGEKYNITGEQEVDNLELAEMIAFFMGKELKSNMVDFHSSRPGHDLRYGLNGDKLHSMGWKPNSTFCETLKDVVEWTMENRIWLEL
jgi:dTDP-glucose 4,6-dehydratase